MGGELKEGKAYMVGKTGAKRPVYVNGSYCESLAAAAKKATAIINREVAKWEIQRALDGQKQIEGVTVTKTKSQEIDLNVILKMRAWGTPLLRYPLGEKPLERGLWHWA